MKVPHAPHHRLTVALVLAAALLTMSEAQGQSTGAAAVFEGRPAMSGAQAGQGAMAGPPQGGLGTQGTDAAQRPLRRTPSDVSPPRDPGMDAVSAANTDMNLREDAVRRDRDSSIAKDERSAVKKSKRAVKRVVKRARTGVGDIDAAGKPGS